MVRSAGRDRYDIALIYERAGDLDEAARWKLLAARFSYDSGDIMGAITYVKAALRLKRIEEAAELYASLCQLLEIDVEQFD